MISPSIGLALAVILVLLATGLVALGLSKLRQAAEAEQRTMNALAGARAPTDEAAFDEALDAALAEFPQIDPQTRADLRTRVFQRLSGRGRGL